MNTLKNKKSRAYKIRIYIKSVKRDGRILIKIIQNQIRDTFKINPEVLRFEVDGQSIKY